jgi:hypothetical protein
MWMISESLVLMSRHQNAGQSHSTERDSRSFENVAKLKHQGTTVTINLIHHGIKAGLIRLLATTPFRTFYFVICCQKTKYTKL